MNHNIQYSFFPTTKQEPYSQKTWQRATESSHSSDHALHVLSPNRPIRISHPDGRKLENVPKQMSGSPAVQITSPNANISRPNLPIDFRIHEYWKGRFAPLPGTSTLPNHMAGQSRTITISKPPGQLPTKSTVLPPPTSPHSATTIIISEPRDSKNNKNNNQTGKKFEFDKYANIFIPQYLKNIQKQPQTFQPLAPTPLFPPPSYLHSFLTTPLIDKFCKPQFPSMLSSVPPSKVPPLDPTAYADHWTSSLACELDKLATDKSDIVLWKTGIKVGDWSESIFIFSVPGIRENYPRLEVGDLVHLREVLESKLTGSGQAFEGRITALRKREGLAHFYCPTLRWHAHQHCPPTRRAAQLTDPPFGPDDSLPLLFNISFMLNARPLLTMEAAVCTVSNILSNSGVNGYGLARRWLFPVSDDLQDDVPLYPHTKSAVIQSWIDTGLNEQQKQAVVSVAMYQSPVPYLISGPPGTGKTRTVVETVLQILRIQPESCILLCAPSNSATDTLVLRLLNHLNPNEMLRLNDENRTFAEVPAKMTPYCYVENDKFALPPWKTLMQYRVVVTSCLDSGILAAAQCTNRALGQLEEYIVSSIHPFPKNVHTITPHWTHLLIDEAAQGSEPELVIPISVVLPYTPEGTQTLPITTPQLVLCGDPNQLGPIVASDLARNAELDRSLLERLFECPLYANHKLARSNLHRNSLIGQFNSPSSFVPFANLVKNYRSHPAILMPPSAIFYDDSLEPCAQNGIIAWSGLPNKNLPLVFIGHEYPEASFDERATWFNQKEIEHVVKTVKSLVNESAACTPPLQPAHIGVMAPWREQVWKMRERLRAEKFGDVDVGTVEDYQGRENRVIIISCVRSNERFLKEDGVRGQGLVHERKRMNVAITRAKELLIVIGNGALLQRDGNWRGFLQFVLRNKLYVGPPLDIQLDGNYISRLESDFLSEHEKEMKLDDEDRGVVMAGGLVREILKGWV